MSLDAKQSKKGNTYDTVLAVDPGTNESAFVLYAPGCEFNPVIAKGMRENDALLDELATYRNSGRMPTLAIEMIASYGMAVGKEVFETCVWIGRFVQVWKSIGGEVELVYRRDIKLHLCQSPRAKDANIRCALVDRFGAPGTKKNPGRTYGISKHLWAALALGVYFADTKLLAGEECSQEGKG